MSMFYVDNAMAWVQIRLRGGWRNIILVSLAYGTLAGGTILTVYKLQTDPRDKADWLQAASGMLLGAQAIILLVLGMGSISMSIRQDMAGKQIESHRLMPLTPLGAVVGYLVGSNVRIVGLALVTLLLGVLTRGLFSVQEWYLICAMMFGFAIMLWSVMALAGFISRGVTWLLVVIFIVILFGNLNLMRVAPGLALLSGFAQISTAFTRGATGLRLDESVFACVAAECILAVLCILAAARRYGHADERGLPIWFGVGFYLLWIAISAYGIINIYQVLAANFRSFDATTTMNGIAGSACVALLAGVLVMACVAHRDIAAKQRRAALGLRRRRAWLPALAAVVFCAGGVALLSYCIPQAPRDPAILSTYVYWRNGLNGTVGSVPYAPWYPAISMSGNAHLYFLAAAIFLLQAYLLMRLFYASPKRSNLMIAAFLLAIALLPLVADLIYCGVEQPNQDPTLNQYGVISPIGFLVNADDDRPKYVSFGLGAQLAILGFIGVMYGFQKFRRARRARAARPPEIPIPPPIPVAG